jgi:dihydropteroate synthase
MMRRNARMKRDVFLADIGTRPLIMGIFNVTPDSFFDGGRYIAGGATLARVRQMDVDGCVEEHGVALRVLRAMRGT